MATKLETLTAAINAQHKQVEATVALIVALSAAVRDGSVDATALDGLILQIETHTAALKTVTDGNGVPVQEAGL